MIKPFILFPCYTAVIELSRHVGSPPFTQQEKQVCNVSLYIEIKNVIQNKEIYHFHISC